ncbi:hypothetical protein [Cellulomonas fimi]|uniref:Uncharacterized protein n=1 Tax=Cellulomonas fimi TaxID=1708 RepID=A0A7Y0M0E7_CELFI|nr:hypothetical protein [Cellulomonas fimi]NMR21306.1 hypothetical protein [Cellulomonas fimi]
MRSGVRNRADRLVPAQLAALAGLAWPGRARRRRLVVRFGSAYERYREVTPRFFGIPRRTAADVRVREPAAERVP